MYQAGTLSGNPLAMAAGLATLRILTEPGVFERVTAVARAVCEAIEAQASAVKIPVQTAQAGTMFGLFFNERPVRNYAEVKTSDAQRYARFFHALLAAGVYFAPSAFEAAFAALAHEGSALDQTLAGLEKAFRQIGCAACWDDRQTKPLSPAAHDPAGDPSSTLWGGDQGG
jgi:glutamate-1-semialdehyde 2,1-aminomutase